MVAARGWGARVNGEVLINGDMASVVPDERVLHAGGDGYTTLGMYLIPLDCTLRNGHYGKRVNYFTTVKKLEKKPVKV